MRVKYREIYWKRKHNITLFIPMCYVIQGIRIFQSNTSVLFLKYTYIQGYVFQLHGAIIRPLQ